MGPGSTVSTTLTCINGVWTYGGGQGGDSQGSNNQGSRVDEIYCPLVAEDNSCSPNQLKYENGATYSNSARRAKRATTLLTVVCPAQGDSDITLKLDNVDTTVVEGGEATAQLYCNNGLWETDDGNYVTTVSCVTSKSDDPCRSCTSSDLSYTNGATSRNFRVNSDGCSAITVVCPADGKNTIILQLDNVDTTTVEGGEATAELVCNDNGEWTSDGNSVSRVHCVETGEEILPATVVPSCDVCATGQITVVMGDNEDSVTPTLSITYRGDDQCLRVTVTCDVSGISDATTVLNVRK